MFDETFIHHAANTTEHQRVVLFCDVERPLWTAPVRWFNRLFGKYVVAAAASENVEGEGVGGLNKFFSVFYKLRLQSKKLKAHNKFLYYLTKWVAILGLLWLIFASTDTGSSSGSRKPAAGAPGGCGGRACGLRQGRLPGGHR